MTRTLYLISSAAPPARQASTGIRAAQARGWDVCLILTPSAHRWAAEDLAAGDGLGDLEALTGHPIRHQYKLPSHQDVLPAPDAILSAPTTLQTLTKWADGHADTLALGLLTEALGLDLPVVALPYINAAQARHPALPRAVATLRGAGVRVLLHDDHEPVGFTPHRPKNGNVDAYPWQTAVDALPVVAP
ncbi:flavoprotein [Streptomyces sp. NPDC015171]|uniref:flavoprotein n=1 Tax=Streptomyces sp. NPDC015171 TaxID=3364945 RepID=UPI0037012A8D